MRAIKLGKSSSVGREGTSRGGGLEKQENKYAHTSRMQQAVNRESRRRVVLLIGWAACS